MTWMRSRVAWVAAVVSLFGLLRALRRLVEPDERPVALLVAVSVVAAAALMPSRLGRSRGPAEKAAWRKALQFFAACACTALTALLGAHVVLAGALGVAAAAVVPVAWLAQRRGRAAVRVARDDAL